MRIECEVNNSPAVNTTLSFVEVLAEGLDVPGLPDNDTFLTAGTVRISVSTMADSCYYVHVFRTLLFPWFTFHVYRSSMHTKHT